MGTSHTGVPKDAPDRLDSGDVPGTDAIVDAVGLFCPIPIVRTAARARGLTPGQVLELRADDPVTLVDLPNWCLGAGHRYLGWTDEGSELRLFLEVGRSRGRRAGEGDGSGS